MRDINVKTLLDISLRAGRTILDLYQQADVDVERKDDDSPLTKADKDSHRLIMEGLNEFYPDTPVLSEEGRNIPYTERESWPAFFLVDPLDGTKEFIKKNGEFTVNIAFIEGHYPTIGLIYAPVLDTLYFAKEDSGAFKLENASEHVVESEEALISKSTSLPLQSSTEATHVVASRSHMSDETQHFIEKLQAEHAQVDVVSAGSSLKFCLVAEGRADYYPRYAPTMEWDTAAGQCLIEGAGGGKVLRYEDEERFYYNRENLVNGWFFAKRKFP